MGVLAVALAAVNVFGGFLVTRRMLEMFKKKEPKAGCREASRETTEMSMNLVTLLYLVASRLLHPGAEGPVAPDHLDPRQPVRHGRHGHRRAHHRGADRASSRRRWPTARPWCWVLVGLLVGGTAGTIMAKTRRDDQDARAGRLHAQHDRPGRGVHRGRRGGRAVGLRHRRASGDADPGRQPARAVPRRRHRRDHLPRLGDRLRQAVAASTSSACSRARRCSSPASTC